MWWSPEPCSSRSIVSGLIPRVVMALGSEVNDSSSKNAPQKVKKCPAGSNGNDKTANENVSKGEFLWSCFQLCNVGFYTKLFFGNSPRACTKCILVM